MLENQRELAKLGLIPAPPPSPPKPGVWVACHSCRRWRRLHTVHSASEMPKGWTCAANPDDDYNRCDVPQEVSDEQIEQQLELADGVRSAAPPPRKRKPAAPPVQRKQPQRRNRGRGASQHAPTSASSVPVATLYASHDTAKLTTAQLLRRFLPLLPGADAPPPATSLTPPPESVAPVDSSGGDAAAVGGDASRASAHCEAAGHVV